MKRNILYVTFVLTLCVVAVLTVKVVEAANKSYDLSMASIEAISNGDNGANGSRKTVSGCDIYKYNREQVEAYEDIKATAEIKAAGGLFLTEDGSKLEVEYQLVLSLEFLNAKIVSPTVALNSI